MTPKFALEAVNKLLQDLCRSKDIMGGKTVVLSGDFRQTLPVVSRGTKADELRLSLRSSNLWKNTIPLKLTENMRCRKYGDEQFAQALLQVGSNFSSKDYVNVHDIGVHVTSLS